MFSFLYEFILFVALELLGRHRRNVEPWVPREQDLSEKQEFFEAPRNQEFAQVISALDVVGRELLVDHARAFFELSLDNLHAQVSIVDRDIVDCSESSCGHLLALVLGLQYLLLRLLGHLPRVVLILGVGYHGLVVRGLDLSVVVEILVVKIVHRPRHLLAIHVLVAVVLVEVLGVGVHVSSIHHVLLHSHRSVSIMRLLVHHRLVLRVVIIVVLILAPLGHGLPLPAHGLAVAA